MREIVSDIAFNKFLQDYKALGEKTISKVVQDIQSDHPYTAWVEVIGSEQIEIAGIDPVEGQYFVHKKYLNIIQQATKCIQCKGVIPDNKGFYIDDKIYCDVCTPTALRKLNKEKGRPKIGLVE